MRRLLPAALLLAASPAMAFWPFDRAFRPHPVKELWALASQGRFEEVAARMDDTLSRKDLRSHELRDAYVLFGSTLEALERFDKALGLYQLATQRFPEDVGLVLAQAKLYQRVSLPEQARAHFERVLSLEPSNAEAHVGLAKSYGRLGLLHRSVEHYRQALAGGLREDPDIWLAYAQSLAGQRDFFNAEQAVREAVQRRPEAAAWESLGVYQQRQGKAEQALASLDEAITLSGDPHLKARRALWLVKAGRDEEAAKEALAEDALGLWVRGLLALRTGRPAEASALFGRSEKAGAGFASRAAAAMRADLEGKRP